MKHIDYMFESPTLNKNETYVQFHMYLNSYLHKQTNRLPNVVAKKKKKKIKQITYKLIKYLATKFQVN